MKQTTANLNIFEKFEKLRSRLKTIIFDQDEAIDEVIDAFIHMAFKPIEAPPKAIFTFLGPETVGKNYLARLLSEHVDEIKGFKIFDMEQYAEPEEAGTLLGHKFVHDEVQEGKLVRFLKKEPKSVIVFDSIEKADNQLQLALLDLITASDHESGLDCSEVVFVFTSTLGSVLYQNKEFLDSFKKNKVRAQSLMMAAVSKEKKVVYELIQDAIVPKLLAVMSRNDLVLFNKLSLASMVRIGSATLDLLAKSLLDKSRITLEWQDRKELMTLLTLSFAPVINVKRVRRKLPDIILAKMTQCIRDTDKLPARIIFRPSQQVKVFLNEILQEGDLLVRKLFKRNETVELSWKEEEKANTVLITLEQAELKKLPPVKGVFQEDLPAVEFSSVCFDDIAGNEPIKKTFKEIIGILQNPELVREFAIDLPRGMLLHGPAGVVKTMFGKAFAREAGRPYIYVSRSDLFDPNYIWLVYQKAREFAPSIVFLDGVDVKGLVDGVYAYMPVDPLVLELDSLPTDPDEFVFTFATAQNRDEVSPLLIAPDRIDLFVEVPELDKEARKFFIEKILEKPNDGKIDAERVARYISGMNGYDLQRIGKEASLAAIRNGLDFISEEILIEQINIIKYGTRLEKTRIRNLEEDLRMTAYHEAGHAVLSSLLLPDIKIEQVTITPRLQSLGFISYSTEDFAGNVSRKEVFNNICVLLAGRMAEVREFGDKGIDSGAANDLEEATRHAYVAIANMGMDEELGPIHFDTLAQNVSKQFFRQEIEKALSRWIGDATVKAEKLVERHWEKIEKLAAVLIKKEIVDGDELEVIMKG
ncbi:MAG: AAA family ATPase [Desulfobulbaceae bacterium]|nr:AAA family ATPase [Desulfobulbaceae bacterium]